MFAVTSIPTMGIIAPAARSKAVVGRTSTLGLSFDVRRCQSYGHSYEND